MYETPPQGTGLANVFVVNSTRKSLWMNISSADSQRSGASAVSMIYTTSSSTTGCMMIPCIETNSNEAMLPRAYLWLRIVVADRFQCLTPGSNLTTKTALVSPPTIPRSPAIKKTIPTITRTETRRMIWIGTTSKRHSSISAAT